MYIFDKLSFDGLKEFSKCKNNSECKAQVHTGVNSLEIL